MYSLKWLFVIYILVHLEVQILGIPTTNTATPEASTSEITTLKSTTIEATPPEFGTPKTTTFEADTVKSTTLEAAPSESGTPKTTTSEADTVKSTTIEAAPSESVTPKTTTSEGDTVKSTTIEAAPSESGTPKTTTSEAATVKSTTLTAAPSESDKTETTTTVTTPSDKSVTLSVDLESINKQKCNAKFDTCKIKLDSPVFCPNGEKGDRGSDGERGLKGNKGESGIPGTTIKGANGEKGDKGDLNPGLQGPPGLKGLPGVPTCIFYNKDGYKGADDEGARSNPGTEPCCKTSYGPPGSPFAAVCNTTETCVTQPSNISKDFHEYNTSVPFWASEHSIDIESIYGLQYAQIEWLHISSTYARQVLRYHCKNSIPFSESNVTKSISLLAWNDAVIYPTSGDTPFTYTVRNDGCSKSKGDEESYTEILFETSVTKRLPIRDIRIKDTRNARQEFYIEHVELCFGCKSEY